MISVGIISLDRANISMENLLLTLVGGLIAFSYGKKARLLIVVKNESHREPFEKILVRRGLSRSLGLEFFMTMFGCFLLYHSAQVLIIFQSYELHSSMYVLLGAARITYPARMVKRYVQTTALKVLNKRESQSVTGEEELMSEACEEEAIEGSAAKIDQSPEADHASSKLD